MDEPTCDFCRKFVAAYKCLDCEQIFCAGCCIKTTFNAPAELVRSLAGDAMTFVKVCPLCKSNRVHDRMDQNPYKSPREARWIESDYEPATTWAVDREFFISVAVILATGIFVSLAVATVMLGRMIF